MRRTLTRTDRRAKTLKAPQGSQARRSQTESLPAPVGGWNARDSIADMNPADAVSMENWFPSTGYVMPRKGYAEHVTDIDGQVESLMPYNSINGSQKLFGAAGASIYDFSTAGAAGTAEVTGLTNARWQSVNFTNTSGDSYLCCFNGKDDPQYFNGTSWMAITSGSTPAITVANPKELDSPFIHKRRMWLIEDGSLSAWYLPVDSVGGAAAEFSLYGLFKEGGSIVAGGTWTIDAGNGLDDYCVFVTSEGEVAVYSGSDPSSGTAWSIQGVWKIGEPIGKRCLVKLAGDLLIICRDGVYPLSAALQSSQVNPTVAITDKIREAVRAAASAYYSNFGWQLLFYPGASMVLLNVPVSEGQDQQQYVMNTITGAWCKFTGVEANCWAISSGIPYFGGNGQVNTFWQNNSDNGELITASLQQAYSYFGNRGGVKQWKMVKPLFLSNGNPAISASLNVDYKDASIIYPLQFSLASSSTWGNARWGQGRWGSGLASLKPWQSTAAVGNSAGIMLVLAYADIEVQYQATDFVFEHGGVI